VIQLRSPTESAAETVLGPVPIARQRPDVLYRVALAALVVACIAALTAFRVADAETGAVTALLVVLPVLFAALAVVDFRSAVAVALFELVLMGAGGRWATYAGEVTGRHVLVATVTSIALVELVRAARAGVDRRHLLGRYGFHALSLAIVFPALWMTLGLVRGNVPSDVLGDGNGFLFFAFAIVVVALLRRGDGAWLRRCLLAACSANAVLATVLIALAVFGAVSLDDTLRTALLTRLEAGGIVGTMPNGAFRLYLGSGLYFQVGLALVTWELVRQPRRAWPWIVFGLLWTGVIGTYTRGLWIGAFLAFAVVVVLGSPTWRRSVTVVAATAALFGTTTLVGFALDRSLPDYIFSRSSTVISTSDASQPSTVQEPGFERGVPGLGRSWLPVDSETQSLTSSVSKPGHSSSRALVLRNDVDNEDDYVAQTVKIQPDRRYVVSAWIDATRVAGTASTNRGLLAWDPVNGSVFTAPMIRKKSGWGHVVLGVRTGPRRSVLQIRLYAALGTVRWDDVRLARTTRSTPIVQQTVPPRPTSATQLGSDTKTDVAGEVSNAIRREQFDVLVRHISERPILGSGFGSIAKDYPYGMSYAYELAYLDLLFKTGVLGLLLFLSFPLRLVWDALAARRRDCPRPMGVEPRKTSVVVAIVLSILVIGATNPYLFAAFGLCPILVAIAWLDTRAEGTD
jgi:hypothetical protein